MQSKIKAFSIIETIVAMILLTITFAVAMSTFDFISNTNSMEIKVNAQLSIKTILAETIRDKTFYDETIERNGFVIEKKVQTYEKMEQANIIHLHLTANIAEKEKPVLIFNTLVEQ